MRTALLTATLLAMLASPATASSSQAVPYSGWVVKNGARAHWMFPREQATLMLSNRTGRTITYQACLESAATGRKYVCWTRTARAQGTSSIRVMTNPNLGKLGVVWRVGGKTVAYWTLYMVGD